MSHAPRSWLLPTTFKLSPNAAWQQKAGIMHASAKDPSLWQAEVEHPDVAVSARLSGAAVMFHAPTSWLPTTFRLS